MNQIKTLLLNQAQIADKVNRLAYQVYEDLSNEKNVIIAGIGKNGFMLAKKIAATLEKISPIKSTLVQIEMDKKNPVSKPAILSPLPTASQGNAVVVVDDVLDSGRTLIYALRPFLDAGFTKIRTVVLADRSHKKFPVSADFSGISLATTLQEHITVVLESGKEGVYLE